MVFHYHLHQSGFLYYTKGSQCKSKTKWSMWGAYDLTWWRCNTDTLHETLCTSHRILQMEWETWMAQTFHSTFFQLIESFLINNSAPSKPKDCLQVSFRNLLDVSQLRICLHPIHNTVSSVLQLWLRPVLIFSLSIPDVTFPWTCSIPPVDFKTLQAICQPDSEDGNNPKFTLSAILHNCTWTTNKPLKKRISSRYERLHYIIAKREFNSQLGDQEWGWHGWRDMQTEIKWYANKCRRGDYRKTEPTVNDFTSDNPQK